MSRTLTARRLSVTGAERVTSAMTSATIASYGPNRVTTASYVIPYVTAIMCSTAARMRMGSPAPFGPTPRRPAAGRGLCGALPCELTSLPGVLPRPDEEARVVEERSAHLQHREARALEVRRELALVPVVRPHGLADRFEDRVGQDPEQAAERGGRTVAPPDLAERGPLSELARVIHEHRVPARLEDPEGLPEELVGRRMDVERVDIHDLIERALAERVAAGEVRVAEGQIREVPGAALLLGHLDQRPVGVEADHREAGLGQQAGEIARAARDVEHPDLAPVDRRRQRRFHELAELRLEPPVRAEALEDVVVHDAVRDREHPIQARPDPTTQRVHDSPRRVRRHPHRAGLHGRAYDFPARTLSTAPRSSDGVNGFRRM